MKSLLFGLLASAPLWLILGGAINTAMAKPKVHAEPPARFVHPFKGTLYTYKVAQGKAYEFCIAANGGNNPAFYPDMLGCSFDGVSAGMDECTIVVSLDKRGIVKPHVMRHEVAHCNGWSAYHER